MKKTFLKPIFKRILLLIIILLTGISVCTSQNVILKISGIKKDKGVIYLTIYNNQESYKKEIPDISKNIKKDNMKDGCLEVMLDQLSQGTWGIAIIDDENCNGKIDRLLFIPKEGFGFSNYTFCDKKKPDFEAFSFQVDSTSKDVKIALHYF